MTGLSPLGGGEGYETCGDEGRGALFNRKEKPPYLICGRARTSTLRMCGPCIFMPCTGTDNKKGMREACAGRVEMETEVKGPEEISREELIAYLRGLAEWRNNDVVKLAFLEEDKADQVDRMDLSGVVELKRNANGTFEAKLVDKVRVLAMLRELMDERQDGELGAFLDGLYGPGDGDEA